MTSWTPRLDEGAGPVYRRIADALDKAIGDGMLSAGTRLPTHRELAHRLGVTVGTVSRAYAEAERRGLIAATVGRGTFVGNPGVPTMPDAAHTPGSAAQPLAAGDRWFAGAATRGAADDSGGAHIDLSRNYPFDGPLPAVLTAALHDLDAAEVLTAIGRYQPANGMRGHREAGAAWLRRFGVGVDADALLIVPGCQGGLAITLLAMCRPGDLVVHEDLTWPGLQATAAAHGLRTLGLAMDDAGLRPDAFEAACREQRPRLLYTMPTLHNPTTLTMPEERRRAIAAIAERYRVPVVEDDVYGFLADRPLPPIRDFAPNVGIYVTSLSKSVAPGLRIGYLAAPAPLLPRLAAAMRTTILMTSSIAAELASRAIDSGAAALAADRQRAEAQARQLLAFEHLAGLDYAAAPAGFHGWLAVPPPWRCDDFVAALAARGVAVTSGAAFAAANAPAPAAESHIRLCLCAEPNRTRLARALGVIADVAHAGAARRLPVV